MMKQMIGLLAVFGFMVGGISYADPILDDPKTAVDKFKQVIDVLNPHVSAYYNFADDDWSDAYTVALYTVKSKEHKLVDLRAGYAGLAPGFGNTALLGFQVDVQQWIHRYLPEKVARNKAVELIGKYAKVGFYGGRNFTDHEWSYGPTFGAEIKF